MSSLLATADVEFILCLMGSLLAKVTIRFSDEFEVRFFRISLRSNGTLWFQPPALKEFNYAKCFIVKNKENWKIFQNYVLDEFIDFLHEKVTTGDISQSLFNKISAAREQQPEEVNPDDIPL